MRHLRSILYALVLGPAVWILTGVGVTRDLTARARDAGTIETTTAALLLLLAGLGYAILLLSPLSPAGPALTGLVFLGVGVWARLAPDAYAGLWPGPVTREGFDLSRPGYALSLLLAVPLLCTALSARRWARYEPPELPLIGTLGRARGKAAVAGTPVAAERTEVITPDDHTQVLPGQAATGRDETTTVLPGGPGLLAGDEKTTVLPAADARTTAPASDDETTVLPAGDDATTLLPAADAEQTTLLPSGDDEATLRPGKGDGGDRPEAALRQKTADDAAAAAQGDEATTVLPPVAFEPSDEPTRPAAPVTEPTTQAASGEPEISGVGSAGPAAADAAEEKGDEALRSAGADSQTTAEPTPDDATADLATDEKPAEDQPTRTLAADRTTDNLATGSTGPADATAGLSPAGEATADLAADEAPETADLAAGGGPPAGEVTEETRPTTDPAADEEHDPDKTRVIWLAGARSHDTDRSYEPGMGETTRVIGPGERTQIVSRRQSDAMAHAAAQAARDRAAQERARQAFRDRAAQERAREAFAERAAREARDHGEQTQVIKPVKPAEPADNANQPEPSGNTEQPQPTDQHRTPSVVHLERPADEVDEVTAPMVPQQRRPQEDDEGPTQRM